MSVTIITELSFAKYRTEVTYQGRKEQQTVEEEMDNDK